MENKLYLLRPREDLKDSDNPWKPWYDKCFGFVICAPDEETARKMADREAGDENRGEFLGKRTADANAAWISPKYSTCVELEPTTEAKIIISDVARA